MFALFQTFVNVTLRRLGPEDLPDSQFLLGIVLCIYVCVQAPLVWMQYDSLLVVFEAILAELLMMTGCVWGLLRLAGYPTRFRRTIVALIGTSALLSAITVPFVLWYRAVVAAESESSLPGVAILLILLWSLAVDGHIFSRALSRPFAIGLMIAICYLLISMSLIRDMLPGQP